MTKKPEKRRLMKTPKQAGPKDPVFVLPPYKVEQVFTAQSETIDWGIELVGVPSLWRQVKGEGIKVAVLDTGIALEHPDLRDAIEDAADFTGSRSGPGDVQGHGTHCAGTIAARENSTGVIGVAPNCRLLIGKVLGDNGSGTIDDIVQGINWAVSKKADIISMSLGSPMDSSELHKAIQDAVAHNVFVICAAGNEGPSLDTVGYPGRYEEVVAVGAIDRNKNVANFSSRGSQVDVVAPGDKILSCYPPRNLAVLSGTSMATPLVAGVCALMLAKHNTIGTDDPVHSPKKLIERLYETAIDLGPSGYDPSYGAGLINPSQLLVGNISSEAVLLLNNDDISASGAQKLADFYTKFGKVDEITLKFSDK